MVNEFNTAMTTRKPRRIRRYTGNADLDGLLNGDLSDPATRGALADWYEEDGQEVTAALLRTEHRLRVNRYGTVVPLQQKRYVITRYYAFSPKELNSEPVVMGVVVATSRIEAQEIAKRKYNPDEGWVLLASAWAHTDKYRRVDAWQADAQRRDLDQMFTSHAIDHHKYL